MENFLRGRSSQTSKKKDASKVEIEGSRLVQCPLCAKSFHQRLIENHAAACFGMSTDDTAQAPFKPCNMKSQTHISLSL